MAKARISGAERRRRMVIRHHLHPDHPAASPTEAAERLVGLHSSDPATVFLSARARVPGITVADVERELYDRPSLFRTLGMRGTLFAVPAGQVSLLLHGCALKLAPAQRKRLVGYVEGSRGCRHRCRHCPLPAVYDGRYRIVDLESILADLQWLTENGAEHVTFGDPDFLNGPAHARRLIEAAHSEFPDLTFDLTVKVEHILAHRSIWVEMAERNVVFVVSAFETVNDRVLAYLDKGHTVSELGQAVTVLREAGLVVRPSWLPFTPWTELSDLDDIFSFIAGQGLMGATDPVQMGIRLLVPEGSLVLSIPGARRRILGPYDFSTLTYTWQSPHPAVDELQRRVLALAEEGSRGEMDPRSTLHAQWSAARRAIGRQPPSLDEVDWEESVPGLTESWFCCAEPTEIQMAGVSG